MASIEITGSGLTSPLQQIMGCDEIEPGSPAGYSMCKALWANLGIAAKLVEKPVALALCQKRLINVPCAIEEKFVEAFNQEWERLGCTNHIRDLHHIARAYGASALIVGWPEVATTEPIDLTSIAVTEGLYFNTYDPLNLSGSIVTNQNPNAPDFQKPRRNITAAGQPYHPSRSVVVFNGTPIYLDYQASSFSFSGRSVFLRALFPLKSYIQTMLVDDMISIKAGLIVAKIKQGSSIANKIAEAVSGLKRAMIKIAGAGNVLTIDPSEDIESINLTNLDGPYKLARDNIIANIATGGDVPAILIKDESYAEGFSDGDVDMMAVVQYIDGIREQMQSACEFFDKIVMARAWNKGFYEAVKGEYPDEVEATYELFYSNAKHRFKAKWPTLIKEKESETVKRNAEKLKSMSDVMKVLLPSLDPENKARLVAWFVAALNDMKDVFSGEMEFDEQALADYEPPAPTMGGAPGEGGGGGE